MHLQELVTFFRSKQSTQQAIQQKLSEINGLEVSAENSVFAIDKNMLQHFNVEQWDTEDKDNIHQNDEGEWVRCYFYERPILFLSLHQYISRNQQFKASVALNYYLRTMDEDQIKISNVIDYIFSATHLTEGIKLACQHDGALTATLGIAILKHQDQLTQKEKACEFLKTILEECLNKDDINNKRKAALFVVRAIYECGFNITTLFAQPVLAQILEKLTRLCQASDINIILQKLFAAIGYREQDMRGALLCYKENYHRILGIVDNNNLPDIQTLLTYFFVGEIYKSEAPCRKNVPGKNGVVMVANRSFLEKVILTKGSDEMLDILFSAGAYLELENQNEKNRITMKTVLDKRNDRLKNAIDNSNITEINRLLDQGAVPPNNINVNIFENKSTFFKDYVFLSRLIESGAKENLRDAIVKAVRYDHIGAVRIFVQAGVDLNEATFKLNDVSCRSFESNFITLLWIAIYYDQQEMVRTLVELGAKINDFTFSSRFYFGTRGAYRSSWYEKDISILHLASVYGANLYITRFLLEQGADINAKTGLDSNSLDSTSLNPSGSNALTLVQAKIDNHTVYDKDRSSYIRIEKLLSIWLIFDKIINNAKINDLHTPFKTVLNEFIKHYSPSSNFSFGFAFNTNQTLPLAVTKAQSLRDQVNLSLALNVGTYMTTEDQWKTISDSVEAIASSTSTDEEEKDLIAICKRFVNYFSVKLKATKNIHNASPNSNDIQMNYLGLSN